MLKTRRIACNDHVGVNKASGFVQHSVFEVFKRQTQGASQNGFVHWGDFEKGKQK